MRSFARRISLACLPRAYARGEILPPLAGLYVLVGRKGFLHEVRYAAVLVVLGVAIYLVRAWRRKEWPLGSAVAAEPGE